MINKINGKLLFKSLLVILFFGFVLNIVHNQNSLLLKQYRESVVYNIVPGTLETIEENITPVSSIEGTWAIVNIVLIIGMALMGTMLYLNKLESDEYEYEEKRFYRRLWPRFATPLPVMVGIIIFLMTENIKHKAVMFDRWTVLFVMLSLIQICVVYMGLEKLEPRFAPKSYNAGN